MGRPKQAAALVRAARANPGDFERVEPPKTMCERCGSTVYALADGSPRGHMVPTKPGEVGFDERVPTMTTCEEQP
jgi:hypothetical protein